MDRASPYSNAFRRAPLLNFIVTTRIIRIPYLFSRFVSISRDEILFYEGNEDCFFGIEQEEEEIIFSCFLSMI